MKVIVFMSQNEIAVFPADDKTNQPIGADDYIRDHMHEHPITTTGELPLVFDIPRRVTAADFGVGKTK